VFSSHCSTSCPRTVSNAWRSNSGVNGVTNRGIINTFAVISRDGACSARFCTCKQGLQHVVLPRYRCLTGTFALPSAQTPTPGVEIPSLSQSVAFPDQAPLILPTRAAQPARLTSSSAALTTSESNSRPLTSPAYPRSQQFSSSHCLVSTSLRQAAPQRSLRRHHEQGQHIVGHTPSDSPG